MKIASGFGGGMGRMADTCGAVTGAFMVLGLKYGQSSPDREAKEEDLRTDQGLCRAVQGTNGSLVCRDLLDCDISTPEGLHGTRGRNVLPNLPEVRAGCVRDSGRNAVKQRSHTMLCELCESEEVHNFHHFIPRTLHSNKWFKKRYTREQMQEGINLCKSCHKAIHDLIPKEKELGGTTIRWRSCWPIPRSRPTSSGNGSEDKRRKARK